MKQTKVKVTTKMLCFVGLFGALSTVLMLFKIPLFFAPAFMKLDVAELPAIIGSFMFGPVAGVCIVIVKLALNLLINGTDSMYVGELSNLFLSCTYVLSASLLYQRHKTKRQAAVSLVTAVLATSVIAVFSNSLVIFPAYAVVYGLEMESLVGMASVVNPFVKDTFTMMLWSVLPFNLVKYGIVSVITFLVYKKLHMFILKILN